MLTKLSVSNYAIINQLSVEFTNGLNTVTGETGAGKSIILGALGLILGNRADLSVLKDKSEKCVVEGIFEIGNYKLEKFFVKNDLDFDTQTILRREITPTGKSRAFINDTPVNLKVLKNLGLKLIDIHSQHQNLELSNQQFQLNLLDSVAGNHQLLNKYKIQHTNFLSLKKELKSLFEKAENANADLDYFQFQFNQLDEAKLQENEQDELEQELEQLTHAEEIKAAFVKVKQLFEDEQFSVIQNIKDCQKELEKIKNYVAEAPQLAERIQSSLFELKDILEETERIADDIEHDPKRIEWVNDRLNLIYSLQQKHHVSTVMELIELKNYFDEKINTVVAYEAEIEKLNRSLLEQEKHLKEISEKLTHKRTQVFSKIQKSVLADLNQLGMPKSKFIIEHENTHDYTANGCDSVSILFSANTDAEANEISKIASGGEMSRLMLAIKNLLRSSKALPTVIFDEIDSGVSGEIALKMGNIIKSFSTSTQIINITHLPQIAAKGDSHFQVYKLEEKGKTFTSIKKLSNKERIEELAKMVGGDNFTDSNKKSAEELLKN